MMRSLRRVMTRPLVALQKKPLSLPSPLPGLPQDVAVDEEICPRYDLKKFYPARPGEVLNNRYQILVKVGWGTSSTTWFARDMRGYYPPGLQ